MNAKRRHSIGHTIKPVNRDAVGINDNFSIRSEGIFAVNTNPS